MGIHKSASRVIIFCLLATFFAQGICHHDPGSHKGHLASRQCGNLLYISSTSSCCNGNITKGLSQRMADCCGSVAYNELNEICCDDSVHTRTSAHEKCCGKALYLSTTHICCKDVIVEKKANHGCCGATLFDKTTHVCCSHNITVKPKNEPCFTAAKDPQGLTNSSTTRPPPKDPELMCGSETYNPKEQICCSGNLYRATALTMCCGDSTYTPFDENVLCCNGTLHHDVPKQSECVGDVVYTNSTCHLSTRPRVGEFCCGGQTFNPKTHICCNGHSHNKKYGHFCCGSDVYNPHNQSMRCCSGRFYKLTQKKEETECCGNVLLEHGSKKTCCSSSTLSILYDTKPKHNCCGHHYYNTSVWSCCAEHLKPTPSHNENNKAYRLKPLMDLIPGICNKSVLFGKVESLALADQRKIVLKTVNVIKDPWLYVTLDHCSSPALENGMTYLWENNTNVYKPLSIPVDQISDIHMFYNVCYQHECQKGG